MRFLATLLLIAAPLLAQDQSEAERERQAEEARRLAVEEEKAAAEEAKTADLRRLVDELRSKSEAKREEAMEALKRANASLDELLPLIAKALETAERARGALDWPGEARTIRLGVLGGGSEEISGSADGTDYTLKSLGEGKYELSATKHDDDGKLMEETKDKGTLKELQDKYAFLRSALAIQVRPARTPQTFTVEGTLGRLGVPDTFETQYVTAWGGGGRVGVSVVAPSEDLRFHLQLPEGAGFIVQQVVPGSRAEQIGIRRMDILLKLDGELIDSPIQLKKLHEKKGVLEIIRRSETRKIDLATVPEETPAETPKEEPSDDGK